MKSRPFPRDAFALLLLASLAAPTRAVAQQAPHASAILLLKGNDTLVVERVMRSASSVRALVAVRGQPSVEMNYSLGAGGTITALNFSAHAAGASPDAAPLQTGTLEFVGDSALLEIRAGGSTRSVHRATKPGAIPLINNDFVPFEQAVRQARARGVTTLVAPLFLLSTAATIEATVELIGTDSARFSLPGNVTSISVDADGNITGGALPAQGIRIVVVTGAAANGISIGKPDYSAPAGAPYTAEEVTVEAKGFTMSGTLTKPSNATAKLPAIVTITGSGQEDRDEYLPFAGGIHFFRQIADTLSRRGIAVLRLDDRGVGGSGGDVNGTTADFADDIRAAVTWLRARSDIDPERIALVGHSEGGAIAPLVASTDAKLAGIVLFAGPAYTGRQIIDFQLRNLVMGDSSIPTAAKDSAVRATRAQWDSTSGKAPWMRFFLDYDPIPTARKVKQPVLILQGATDQQVRPEEAKMLEKALTDAGNRKVAMRIFPERNHLFLHDPVGHPRGYDRLTSNKVDSEVLGALADWLVVTLRVR